MSRNDTLPTEATPSVPATSQLPDGVPEEEMKTVTEPRLGHLKVKSKTVDS
jgi:hypothetical protein